MATNNLIFLTGATGFIGFKTLVVALQAGYNVRIAVRSASKSAKVLNSPPIKSLNLGADRLSTVVVPDIAAPGAYDEAVQGADYVIHCASKIPDFNADEEYTQEKYKKVYVTTAVEATLGILESIRKAGTAQRVVITSSITAHVAFQDLVGFGDGSKIWDAESRIPVDVGPYESELQAYCAGKAAALNGSEKWVKEKQPKFDLIHMLPGIVFGRNDLNTSIADFTDGSTNSALMKFLQGSQSDDALFGNFVFIADVAKLQVLALDRKVGGNQAFSVNAGGLNGYVWEDSIKVVEKYYAKAIAQGLLKTTGKQPTATIRVDTKKTKEVFGIQFADFEHQVRSLVDHYLEIAMV